jgi:L-rhamnose isomerase/sugar isomerase
VRPLLQKSRLEKGGALNPLGMYRQLSVRQHLIDTRGSGSTATGL